MNQGLKDLFDAIAKILGGLGFFIAALVYRIQARSYRDQVRIKQAEWLKSLYEKFFENPTYKEARVWLDYGYLHDRLTENDKQKREENEEKFTDFLNFFEFIGVLYSRNHLTIEQINEVFDYYLKKIKLDPDCQKWIQDYSFEKLKALLNDIV
jgi:hypothetical protein